MVKRISIIVFLVWVGLWIWFIVRENFLKGRIEEYKVLLSRDLDGKRSHITGDRLYEFIKFAGNVVPPGASYKIIGLKEGSIENKRAVYYLYPRMEAEDTGYLLVYGDQTFRDGSYEVADRLDDSRYVLKRRGR